eukprot:4341679-Amphidinium_carterae.1
MAANMNSVRGNICSNKVFGRQNLGHLVQVLVFLGFARWGRSEEKLWGFGVNGLPTVCFHRVFLSVFHMRSVGPGGTGSIYSNNA